MSSLAVPADEAFFRKQPYRSEVIDGVEYAQMGAPTANHNEIVMNVGYAFRYYLSGKPCRAYAGIEVHLFGCTDHVVPDALILCDMDKMKDGKIYGAPDLVMEVLSPSTAHHDRNRKMKTYEKAGVNEYWIIGPKDRTIDVHVLQDGKYIPDYTYVNFLDHELEGMKPEEREIHRFNIMSPTFPDMDIKVSDIFENLVPEGF